MEKKSRWRVVLLGGNGKTWTARQRQEMEEALMPIALTPLP